MTDSSSPRRDFLKGAGAASVMALGLTHTVRAAPSETVRVGVIGPGGMGGNHVRRLAAREEVQVVSVCDVDRARMAKAAEQVRQISGRDPQQHEDLRRVLDDDSIDAVFIATPDHWHAPASILALQAGKHVYVEKPCCHNIREGQLMADAVAKSGKLLQVGTQSRSTEVVREAIQRVHEGEIGEVLSAKAWNSQRRGTIGRKAPADPPEQLNYDLWVGPAPMVPYRPNLLPGIWRWWTHFGCGDIGNDGVHDIDVALWGLGVDTHPSTAACLGGKYFFDDDQEFPDTQYAVFEYPGQPHSQPAPVPTGRRQLIFEQRDWSPYVQEGYENGAAFYGTQGLLIIGHTVGWKLYGPRMKLLAERTGPADLDAHHQNFLDCIRGRQQRLNADVHAGRLSATVVHLANIAARTQSVLQFDPQQLKITNHPEADQQVGREYREHWAAL